MYIFHISPEFSNLIGYIFGLLTSYFLNRNLTFNTFNSGRYEFVRFLIVFFISYALNFIVLIFLIRILIFPIMISQFISGIFYISSSFLLNKYFVFRSFDSH